MIETPTITERWRLIRNLPPHSTWQSIGLGGELDMKAAIEAGTFIATFRARNRELTPEEEQLLVAACQVPETAERVPAIGQVRQSPYRPGIYGGYVYAVEYRWTLKERT